MVGEVDTSLGGFLSVSPTPSPEGCYQVANGVNCNFDRQEAQILWIFDQAAYVFMAAATLVLALAIYSLVTGRSPIPARIGRLLPRTPASLGDQRRLSGAVTIVAFAILVDLIGVSLSYPGGFGYPAGPLARSPISILFSLAMIVGFFASGALASGVRFLDRKKGTVASVLDQLRGRPPLSRDGKHYWNGSSWVTTLSPDGRHRWNGRGWVPVEGLRGH